MSEQNNQTATSPEQAADLAALQAGAKESVSAEAVAEVAQQQNSAEKIKTELSGLVQTFVAMAGPVLPSLKVIYTPEVTQQAAEAVAAVCVKHGWLGDGIMGGYGEEIAAAVVLFPIGFATVQGVKADLARLKPEKKQDKPGQQQTHFGDVVEDTVSGKVVMIGAPIPEEGGANA